MRKRTAHDLRVKSFIHEYVNDFNATRAYIAAGYSKNGASVGASRLLANAKIRAQVAELVQKRCDELSITKGRILRELALLGFSNMQDYLRSDDEGGLILDFSALTREQAAAIQEIREDTTGGTGDGERKRVIRTTFKLANKRDSLELLGKHLGLFNEKIQLSGADGEPLAVTVRFVKAKDA